MRGRKGRKTKQKERGAGFEDAAEAVLEGE
jgi:hypothetical protein